jgi:hypothetical protein
MPDQGLSFGDAVGRFAEQKTLAESHGTLLKRHVSEQTTLALGQRLYDEARAKFGGVIQRVLFDLTDAGAPKDSPALRAR